MYPKDLKYTKEHEWIKEEDDNYVVGITLHAQEELGDIVFVELPEVGEKFEQGESFAVVESVKAVSDIYAPVSGKVIKVNEKLLDKPELINEDPYGEGWIAVFEIEDPAEIDNLLSADEYKQFLEEEA
ncbi:MAG: glycine cleavage system protein [Thermosediminibacterales bacterium]|nr:glycine cleavage system protein [Thermosediminibacterales bacterium]